MQNVKENTPLSVHFDVEEHAIDLDTFVSTARGIQNIAGKLNNAIFEKPPKVNILILPPKPGSLLELLGVVLDSGTIQAAIALKIIDSEEVRALIKGLTGHDYTYYCHKAGECLRDAILGILKKKTAEVSNVRENLPKDSMLREAFENMMIEKDKIYRKWANNKKINRVGFSEHNEFPISSNEFSEHFYSPQEEKKYKRFCLVIVEAVTVKESQAKWTFENKRTKERFAATMEDKSFRHGFFDEGLYALKERPSDDIIDAYVEYTEKNGKFFDYKIIRVYKFNEKLIAEPPPDLDFEKVLPDSDPNQQIFRF